jgi:hypothetical protein
MQPNSSTNSSNIRWTAAIASATAAIAPVASHAAIVSNADLDYNVAINETYHLPGLTDFEFSRAKGANWVQIHTSGNNGARLGMNYLVQPNQCSWGTHPTNEHTINCNPGYVGAGVFNGPHLDTFEGGMSYSGGGTFSGTPEDHGYLGFLFQRDDGTHYGWVEVTVRTNGSGWEFVDDPDYTLIVNGYGYETEAGVGILTGATGAAQVPEPDALALAAIGILGAATATRRRQRKAPGAA